jgi:hypothetical protein
VLASRLRADRGLPRRLLHEAEIENLARRNFLEGGAEGQAWAGFYDPNARQVQVLRSSVSCIRIDLSLGRAELD